MKRFGWLAALLLALYFIFLIRQDIIDNLGLKKELRRAQKNLAQAEGLSAQMRRNWQLLKQDNFIEELARTRLGLVKKGEVAFKVID